MVVASHPWLGCWQQDREVWQCYWVMSSERRGRGPELLAKSALSFRYELSWVGNGPLELMDVVVSERVCKVY